MSLPFFFPVLLMVNGGFTTLYSMFSRCSAFLFFRIFNFKYRRNNVCACKGNAWLALAMLQQSRCRI